MNKKIYIIGSLRNPKTSELGNEIRKFGFSVFDEWYAAGPEADDFWQRYEQGRGHTFSEALQGLMAEHIFNFDNEHLRAADIGVLVLPAGKSGHLELGVLIGLGKRTYILLDGEPERFDVMYRYADAIFNNKEELFAELKRIEK